MQEVVKYPKRLIEVDLPIKEISAHARREKSIRHGHISTLHLWWARRPLAACRAVICASLWPDPGDDLCPPEFQERAAKALCTFAGKVRTQKHLGDLCKKGWKRWQRTEEPSLNGETRCAWELRYALLDFIADFANWDASNVPEFLEAARAITQAAHETLGGEKGTRPLAIDPFAGGGSIPLESLRVGADAFASDLNPVAVLLNKVVVEYVPRFGQKLAEEVHRWGRWIRTEMEQQIGRYYPNDEDGAVPIAFIWARTIISEAPTTDGIPVEVPLLRSMIIAKRGGQMQALRWCRDSQGQVKTRTATIGYADGTRRRVKQPLFDLFSPDVASEAEAGTSAGGSATCPVTGHTTPVERIRGQLEQRKGGTADARLMCVVVGRPGQQGRFYRVPNKADAETAASAADELTRKLVSHDKPLTLLPNEPLNHLRGFFNIVLYGMKTWGDLFTPRQALTLSSLAAKVIEVGQLLERSTDRNFAEAVQTCLALAVNRQADRLSSLARWDAGWTKIANTFGRQALPMVWDFAEANPFSGATGDWDGAVEWVFEVCSATAQANLAPGRVERSSATHHPLPDNCVNAVVTDPPYYAAVPYADLSDFFYTWLKRSLGERHPSLLQFEMAPKDEECVSLSHRAAMYRHKNGAWFERTMVVACTECSRVVRPDGVGVFVFASKDTPAWEAMLAALVEAGWIVTGSWPIDTEMGSRLRAQNSATLASSIHIVCRPRKNSDGSLRMDDIGDWRDVLLELPKRIHEWMPRLAEEGVVGADAIFACLGPALEIFSRYSHVEDAAGHKIELRTYLEKVWETVAREALSVIFSGADAAGFEPDARLTAMWLWTLFSAASSASSKSDGDGDDEETDDEDDEDSPKTKSKGKVKGFALEFDAARKIAQGLGADLEQMESLVEIKGETARLLSVDERRKALFGKAPPAAEKAAKAAKKRGQLKLGFQADSGEEQEPTSDTSFGVGNGPVEPGATVLDRVHQAMLLFGANQSGSLKRFLVEQGVGRDNRFWSFADHLSKLYPAASSEKRLVDGVLARKKGLGF